MSLNSYTTIKTAVGTWLNRSDLTGVIPDLITLGEARIYRDLRIAAMETDISEAITSGVVAVPSGYIEMKHFYVFGAPVQKLQRKTAEWIYTNYPTRSADSKPLFFAREGGNFIFGPYSDSTYTVKGSYYKRLDALSASNETNWFTANAPELVLFAALSEAEPYIGNDLRAILWKAKYDDAKNSVQRQDINEEFSGSILQVTAA
ncbi:MAG: hypothetical protein WC047_00535 [Kiritimatiellales bacterium]